jgi:uncharacterized protein (DUF58 family)
MSRTGPENAHNARFASPSGRVVKSVPPARSLLTKIQSSLVGEDFASPPSKPLSRKKVRIRPTLYGWALLFLIFWVPFTAIATANNFLFIVFIMLVGLAFVSHRLGKGNVRSVQVERQFPDEIFAGSAFVLKYMARVSHGSRGALTLTFAELSPIEGTGQSAVFLKIPPDTTTTVDTLASIASRGYKTVMPGMLTSSFPFGLATYTRQAGQDQRVLVFPHIVSVDADVPSWAGRSGKGFEKAGPFGTVPFHLREYVPGDPYKRIEWKKTAQTGTIMSKVLSEEEAREIVIRVPKNASERAISRAASLVVHFSKTGTPLKLVGPGFSVGPDRGRKFTIQLLTMLARWEEYTREGLEPPVTAGVTVSVDPSGDFQWQYGASA